MNEVYHRRFLTTLALNNTDHIPIIETLLLLFTVIYALVIFSYEINHAQSVNIYHVAPQSKRIPAVSILSITAIITFPTSQLPIKFRESTVRFTDSSEIFLLFDTFGQLLLQCPF